MSEKCHNRTSRRSPACQRRPEAGGFDSTLGIVVTSFLQHPTIAIQVREVGEARVVPVCGVEPGCETSVPGINWYLVPDLADFDPAFDEVAPRRPKIGDDEIGVANGSRSRVGQSLADL